MSPEWKNNLKIKKMLLWYISLEKGEVTAKIIKWKKNVRNVREGRIEIFWTLTNSTHTKKTRQKKKKKRAADRHKEKKKKDHFQKGFHSLK